MSSRASLFLLEDGDASADEGDEEEEADGCCCCWLLLLLLLLLLPCSGSEGRILLVLIPRLDRPLLPVAWAGGEGEEEEEAAGSRGRFLLFLPGLLPLLSLLPSPLLAFLPASATLDPDPAVWIPLSPLEEPDLGRNKKRKGLLVKTKESCSILITMRRY